MTRIEGESPAEKPFSGSVRRLREADLEPLRPILETWIKDRFSGDVIQEEVESVLQAMRESTSGLSDRLYYVAENDAGEVIGTMGLRLVPDVRMLPYATTPRPAELVNAFIHPHFRREGYGHALVSIIEVEARSRGITEIILNSGPRYRYSGWGAWNNIFGQPVALARDFYDLGAHAPVWSKIL